MKAKEKTVNKEAFTSQELPAKVEAKEKPKRERKSKETEKKESVAGSELAVEAGNATKSNETKEAGAESETHAASENEEKTENGMDSDVRAETPMEPELEGQAENTEESGPVTGTVNDTEPDAKPEPEIEPQPSDKPKPEPESEGKPVSHAPETTPAATAPVQVVESPLRRMKQEFHERSQIIKEQMRNIQNAFITIGFQLHWIRNNNMYRVLDYKNVYEYAEKEYGIKKTTCCNFISIIENYAERDGNGEVIESIADCYRNYSASQLVAMLGMSEEMKQQVTPGMSVRAINRMRKGEEEKPVAETAAPLATAPVAETADKEPAAPEDVASKEAAAPESEDATVPGGTGAEENAADIPEEQGNTVDSPETESVPEQHCNPETSAMEPVGDTGTEDAEITGVTENEEPPEETLGEPLEDNPYAAVGTLVEIDSYTGYRSIADKIDAMIRRVFSANVPVKVRIVCEQG